MGRMIYVEGLDLAGKSTLVQGLAERFAGLGWRVTVAHGDLCRENPVAKVARRLMRWDPNFTAQEGAALFLASHLWDLRNFQVSEDPWSVHIQDSWALRSLAFERILGQESFAAEFQKVVDRQPAVDAAFVLTASLETRMARFATRAVNDLHDQFMFRNPVMFSQVDSELLRLSVATKKARMLITDEMDAQEVLNQVWSSLPFPVRRARLAS